MRDVCPLVSLHFDCSLHASFASLLQELYYGHSTELVYAHHLDLGAGLRNGALIDTHYPFCRNRNFAFVNDTTGWAPIPTKRCSFGHTRALRHPSRCSRYLAHPLSDGTVRQNCRILLPSMLSRSQMSVSLLRWLV